MSDTHALPPRGIRLRFPRQRTKPLRMATCHPDRKHAGRGLCDSCLYVDWCRRHSRTRRRASCHPEKTAYSRGLCHPCYVQAKREGTLPKSSRERSLYERIMAKVDKTISCWIWQGKATKGVPVISDKHVELSVRWYLWEHEHGPMPDGMFATVSCGVDRCIRFEHIVTKDYVGIHARESVSKKGHMPPGAQLKVPHESSKEMLDLWEQGYSTKQISTKFGITPSAVSSRLKRLGKQPAHQHRGPWIDYRRLARGQHHSRHRAVLTEEIVKDIAALRDTDMRCAAIAKQFHVSRGAIEAIFRGETWSWLTGFSRETCVHRDTRAKGTSLHSARLTPTHVMEIVERDRGGESPVTLAKSFLVDANTIRSILDGHTWGWLTGIPRRTSPGFARGEAISLSKLTKVTVLEIVELSQQGETPKDLAKKFSVSRSAIAAVLHGRTWSWLTGIQPKSKPIPQDPHPDEALVWQHWTSTPTNPSQQ